MINKIVLNSNCHVEGSVWEPVEILEKEERLVIVGSRVEGSIWNYDF